MQWLEMRRWPESVYALGAHNRLVPGSNPAGRIQPSIWTDLFQGVPVTVRAPDRTLLHTSYQAATPLFSPSGEAVSQSGQDGFFQVELSRWRCAALGQVVFGGIVPFALLTQSNCVRSQEIDAPSNNTARDWRSVCRWTGLKWAGDDAALLKIKRQVANEIKGAD
jgi:hypothetical protein